MEEHDSTENCSIPELSSYFPDENMSLTLEGTFQFLLSLSMSIAIGTPQATFSSVQHFMLEERLYEDLCKVSSLETNMPLFCLESRAAYLNVYNGAGLAFAIALTPAYYSVRYFGPAFINFCCGLIYAAGIVFISDRPEDQWISDRYAYGYALMSAAAPFALLNMLRGITTLTTSKFSRLFLLCIVISLVNLGPFVMVMFAWQFMGNDSTVHELFTKLLWMPVVWVLLSVLFMPLSDSAAPFTWESLTKYIKTHFTLGRRINTLSLSSEYATAFESDCMPLPTRFDPSEYNHKSTWLRTVVSGPFVTLLLIYFTHSLPLDLMYVGGEARAAVHEELSVWSEISLVSPLVAAAIFPIIFWVSSYYGLIPLSGLSCTIVILQTAMKFWSVKISWLSSSSLVGTTQATLAWTCALCFVKCVRIELISISSAVFFGTIAILKFIALPTFDLAVEFETLLYGFDPYLLTLVAQLLSAILLALVLRNEFLREQRFLLENEARLTFDRCP